MDNKETNQSEETTSEQPETEKTTLEEEIAAGEWERLKEFPHYQKRSRQGKIIATYQAVSARLNQLVVLYYKFVSINPQKAVKLLEELRRLRFIQEILLNCLIWEPKGQLEKNAVPKEVWDLIE
jgi:hypothetical protein